MIKANELRIGNILNGGIVVESIDDTGINTGLTNSCLLSNANPIPLSPEILEKAGLTKSDKVDVAYIISIFTDLPDGKIHRYHKEGLSEPKYLHQLQNLYFALTGTELEINLT